MSYKVIVAAHAEQDIDEIVSYIAIKLCNPQAAEDFLSKSRATFHRLDNQPAAFPLARNPALAAKGYRWVSIKNYMAFYTIDEKRKEVFIVRVVFGSRNLDNI